MLTLGESNARGTYQGEQQESDLGKEAIFFGDRRAFGIGTLQRAADVVSFKVTFLLRPKRAGDDTGLVNLLMALTKSASSARSVP